MSQPAKNPTVRVPAAPRTSEISSSRIQDRLGAVLARVAAGERVVITRYGEPQAALVPMDEFREMIGQGEPDLAALEKEFNARVARMQTDPHRTGVAALFAMSGPELGEAAAESPSLGKSDGPEPEAGTRG
ncbi:MAG: type II toxin-antitoxin system prevent-host-death family antitoxin [Gemmatimonadota bacterium]